MRKYFLLCFLTLLVGCSNHYQLNYEYLITQPDGSLVGPPQPDWYLPGFYENASDAYYYDLVEYRGYVDREITALAMKKGIPGPDYPKGCITQFVLPEAGKEPPVPIVKSRDPEVIVEIVSDYALRLLEYQREYRKNVREAYGEYLRQCAE